jgi:hypothetical protein
LGCNAISRCKGAATAVAVAKFHIMGTAVSATFTQPAGFYSLMSNAVSTHWALHMIIIHVLQH